MSLNALDSVAQNVSSALDFGKIMGVFNTFVGIIKDQQSKLDKAESEINELRAQIKAIGGSALGDKIRAIDEKLDDFIQQIQGGGNMDASILHAEASPFSMQAFMNAIPESDEGSLEDDGRLPKVLEEEGSQASLDEHSFTDASLSRAISGKADDKWDGMSAADEAFENTDPAIQEDTSPTPPSGEIMESEPVTEKTVGHDDDQEEAMPSVIEPLEPVASAENDAEVAVEVAPATSESTESADPPKNGSEPGSKPRSRSASRSATPVQPVGEEPAVVPVVAREGSAGASRSASRIQSGKRSKSRGNSASMTIKEMEYFATALASNAPFRAGSLIEPSTSADAVEASRRASRSYSISANTEVHPDEKNFLEEISTTIPMIIDAMRRPSSARPMSARPMSSQRPLSGSASATLSLGNNGSINAGIVINAMMRPTSARPFPTASLLLRRKMDVNRLPWLTSARAKRILSRLRTQGRFITISKRMIEEGRKRYAATSLKNRIDLLESELSRLLVKSETMKESVKRNTAQLKELYSPDIVKVLEEMGNFIRAMQQHGGMEAIIKLFLHLKDADMSLLSAQGQQRLMLELQQRLSQELLGQVASKMQQQGKDYMTKQEILQMLQPGTASEQNMDANHLKLLQVIQKSMQYPLEQLDSLRIETEKRLLDKLRQQQEDVVQQMQGRQGDLQLSLEERLRQLTQQLSRSGDGTGAVSATVEEDMAIFKAKIKKMDEERAEFLAQQEEQQRQRQQEHEALKVLQRRLAGISVDKLTADLNSVRAEVHQRPSAQQVEEMVSRIETTFKSHLGDNVNGLTNLVSQVYKYLQTKVDREDIRKLIATKLVQMEQELIYREEEMLSAAGTANRCISCGQLPAVQRPRTSHPSSHAQQHRAAGNNNSLVMDDEEATPSRHSPANLHLDNPANYHTTSSPFSSEHNEQVYSLLTGQVGLRPLQLQHAPLQPVNNPYAGHPQQSNRPQTTASTLSSGHRLKPVDRLVVPEPAFRKARMAAQMKEAVKVAGATMEQYGYPGASNPFYITDSSAGLIQPQVRAGGGGRGYVGLDALSMNKGGGLRGAGANIIGSQSTSSLPPHMQQQQQSHPVLSHSNTASSFASSQPNDVDHHPNGGNQNMSMPHTPQGHANSVSNHRTSFSEAGPSRRMSSVVLDGNGLESAAKLNPF